MPLWYLSIKAGGRLLLAEDGLFAGLRDAELYDFLCRDLDRFAGLGIPAHAGLAIHEHKLSEAGQREGIFCFLVSQRRHVLQNLNRILPKGELLPVPMLSRVVLGTPLTAVTDEDKDAFLARARDALLQLRATT